MTPRRVLLISPLPHLDPPCGDVVYTQGLLEHPPPGVEYETYAQALAAGRLRELGRRSEFRAAAGRGRLRALGRIGRERAVNALRKSGLLFREPFRYFLVRPGAYDLVHCHVFSAAFPGLDAPLVMSNAGTIEELYRGARRWSETRIRFAAQVDAALAKRLGVQHTSHGMPAASAVVCFTEALRCELLRRGSTTPERLHVAPCFVEPAARVPPRARPRRIGFVASDFDAKGGPVVLEAFENVRRSRPDAELLVIGSPPRGETPQLRLRGITWYPHMPRSVLLDHLPSLDVFAYPTESDGLPLIVLEVMALGVPVATSDYLAMPEIIGHGIAGSVTAQADASALAVAILRLLEPEENARARQQTAAWFDAHYAPGVAVAQLGRAYEAAAAAKRLTSTNARPIQHGGQPAGRSPHADGRFRPS
jgi:glycosyltransferase involved in cell wall biosynthesis